MTAEEQARCLRVLEQANSAGTAARTCVLGAFAAAQGPGADAEYSPRAWLIHKTGVTRGAAMSYTAWVRRAEDHPLVFAAWPPGTCPSPWPGSCASGPTSCRKISGTPRTTSSSRRPPAGMSLRDLAELFGEIYEQARSACPDEDKDEVFDDRAVRLITTFQGAGVLSGDLTPECAEAVAAVLDALAAPAGAEDSRTQPQRYHDALAEAMRRLVAAGVLPERAGQPVKIWAHISLADLLRLQGSSALQEQWTAQVRARWAGHRAAASEGGGDTGTWLDGDAAEAIACDAAMAPIVTGDLNPGVLDDLVRLCVELDRLRRDGEARPDTPDTTAAWAAIEQAVIGQRRRSRIVRQISAIPGGWVTDDERAGSCAVMSQAGRLAWPVSSHKPPHILLAIGRSWMPNRGARFSRQQTHAQPGRKPRRR